MTQPDGDLPGLTESTYRPDPAPKEDTAREIHPVTLFGKTGNPADEIYDFRPKAVPADTPEVEVPKDSSAAEFVDCSPEAAPTSHPEEPEIFVDAAKASGELLSVPSRLPSSEAQNPG